MWQVDGKKLKHQKGAWIMNVKPDQFGSGNDILELIMTDSWESALVARVSLLNGDDHNWVDPQYRATQWPSPAEAAKILSEALAEELV